HGKSDRIGVQGRNDGAAEKPGRAAGEPVVVTWPNVMTATKYVASNTRDSSDWQPTVFLSGDLAGIEDKKYLRGPYGKELGKASVTGYCIRFKTLKDINLEILEAAIRYGFEGPY